MLRAGFGDEDWFLHAFFDFVWQRCDTLLSLQDGVPAAMTALLPCQVYQPGQASLPALYLYALTTLPAHRGQGMPGGCCKRRRSVVSACFYTRRMRPCTPFICGLAGRMRCPRSVCRCPPCLAPPRPP